MSLQWYCFFFFLRGEGGGGGGGDSCLSSQINDAALNWYFMVCLITVLRSTNVRSEDKLQYI